MILGPFFPTCKDLIDVELGELTLSFNNEKVVLNVFEEIKHHEENPSILPSGYVQRGCE